MKVVAKLLVALALTAAFAGCSGLATNFDDSYSQTENKD
jgi:ABC-type glycerol-3-phosphate transport system substrate-binding protein